MHVYFAREMGNYEEIVILETLDDGTENEYND